MSKRRAISSRAVAGIAWLAILGASFGGGLWVLDGSERFVPQSSRLSYKLPFCDERDRTEPNCIVRKGAPVREAPGAGTSWDSHKMAIAAGLAL